MKDEIDQAAEKVKESIADKVKRIRNEVMEEETGRNMDYIERKKRSRREKKMAKREKLYTERLQKRKEFDEAGTESMDSEKTKAGVDVSSGEEKKYSQAAKKVMPVSSDDEEILRQKMPNDNKKEKYSKDDEKE